MSMVDNAVGLMIAAIVIGAVSIPVVQSAISLETNNVANETLNATTLVYNYTVDKASETSFGDLAQAQGYNTTAQSTTVPTQILDSKEGLVQFNYTGKVADAGNLSTYTQSVQYEWEDNSYVNNSTARLVLGFVTVGLAVSLFMASFSMVR